MTKDIKKTLIQSGLNEKQADIYLACLELGSASVQKIAQKAGLPRSTVYETLEILKDRGYISTFLKKKVRHYSAEEPERVVLIAQQKADLLKSALPQLEAMVGKNRKRPSVRFYQGTEQMNLVLEEVLKEADAVSAFGSAEDLLSRMGEYWDDFVKRRVDKKIPVRAIMHDSPEARQRQEVGPKYVRTIRLVQESHNTHGLTMIWKNKIAMFSFIDDLIAVVIDSRQLSDMQKAQFEHLWERLK
ncbi:helix-turn-helix domain-containing protein [Patescibacteria group bacterium]|nr:helix-turn-helix domain-containing protein [Patescibacteria group bacterium]